jgi:hypothetical protein
MDVSSYVQNLLVKQLPNIELCHEQIIHQKVHYHKFDYFRIIPKGHKGLLWFKKDSKNNTFCYFISMKNINSFKRGRFNTKNNTYAKFTKHKSRYSDNNSNIKTKDVFYMKQFYSSFHPYLTNGHSGTILFGTHFSQDSIHYFSTEDILYYKGECLQTSNWNIKFNVMYEVLNENIRNEVYSKHNIVVLSSFIRKITKNIDENQFIETLPYSVYSIQYLTGRYNNIYTKKYTTQRKQYKMFNVQAELNNDIYSIYDSNNNNIGYLHIPSFEKSVMMNSLFRTIKENTNLDYLEESDDEEEFENIDTTKFVDLHKTILIKCLFNDKHKMWEPIELCDTV